MKSKVYLVDLDGTLTKEIGFTEEACYNAKPNIPMIDRTNELYRFNFIVIYTARRDELIPVSLEWLRRNGVRFHAFSNNKVPADYYVDDRMISFEEYLEGDDGDQNNIA
jgi:uncharacterized HAD superfamily protein